MRAVLAPAFLSLRDVMTFGESFRLGVRSSLGYVISTFLFGVLFGVAAASADFAHWQVVIMSAAVFSASAQFAALEFWIAPLPLATIALSVFLISTRNILLGMSMANHFDGHSVSRRAICLFILNDPGVVTSFGLKGDYDRLGFVTGYGCALMTSWLTSSLLGFSMAQYIPDQYVASMSFAGPLVMATMMVLFAKGSDAEPLPWVVSGLAALVLHELAFAPWVILPCAVSAGVVAALWVNRNSDD
ncbi:MAG: AzlC family ABC transporter permease [Pseudomonadota bacterium]